MDEDFLDVTESSKKTGIILVLVIVAILIFGYFFVYQKVHFGVKNIKLELGEELPTDVESYLKKEVVNTDGYDLDLSKVRANEVGEYTYTITYNKITRKGKVEVEDTTPPSYVLQEMNVEEGTTDYYLGDFLASCEDLSKPCLVEFKNDNDADKLNEVGTHKIEIVISDLHGNKKTDTGTLNVIEKGEYVDPRSLDLEYASNSKGIEKFDGIVFKKLETALSPMGHEADGEMSNVSATDLETYIKENHKGYTLIKSEIIELFNKSSFVIGYSILLTVEDEDGKEKEIYVDPDKVPEAEAEDEPTGEESTDEEKKE